MTRGAEVAAGLVAARVVISREGVGGGGGGGADAVDEDRGADRARARVRARARDASRRRAAVRPRLGRRRAFEPLGRIRGAAAETGATGRRNETERRASPAIDRRTSPIRIRSRRDAFVAPPGRVPPGPPDWGGFGGAVGRGGRVPGAGGGVPDARATIRRPGVRARQRRRPRRRCERWVRRWRRDGCRRRCLGRGCVPALGGGGSDSGRRAAPREPSSADVRSCVRRRRRACDAHLDAYAYGTNRRDDAEVSSQFGRMRRLVADGGRIEGAVGWRRVGNDDVITARLFRRDARCSVGWVSRGGPTRRSFPRTSDGTDRRLTRTR